MKFLLKMTIFFLLCLLIPITSFANGGLFTPFYQDIYEPNQLAMIVFDDMVEKIIFQVDYEGEAENFAWVIPVPSYPYLFSVEDDIFYELHQLTRVPAGSFPCGWGQGVPTPGFGDEDVHIWEENQVGIYDTVTLSASDPDSLLNWLNNNGFTFPLGEEEVLDHYIQKQWFFVAMKIHSDTSGKTTEYYSGAIQPLGVMFFSEEMIYPMKISAVSTPSWGTEVLIYTFSNDRVFFPGAMEEYSDTISPQQLDEYPILESLIDETFVLTKLRKIFMVEEIDDDLVLVSIPKEIALESMIDMNTPIGQFVLIMGIFISFIKIKSRLYP